MNRIGMMKTCRQISWSPVVVFLVMSLLAPIARAEVVEVVASGVGVTPDAATKAALRSAVEQVVGQLVDANTLVANEDVVSDKILTYSGGYVEGYEAIKEPTQGSDGLYSTKIKARVKKTELVEKLRAENVTKAKISGTSLFAQMATKTQQADEAAVILADDFKDMPVKFLTVSVATKPDGASDLILDERTGEVSVGVVMRVDTAAYDNWVKGVAAKLDVIADFKYEALLGSKYNDQSIRAIVPLEIIDQHHQSGISSLIIGLEVDRSPDRRSAIWKIFRLAGPKAESIGKMLWVTASQTITVDVRMTDANGRLLGGNTEQQNVKVSTPEAIISYPTGQREYRSGDEWYFAPMVSVRPWLLNNKFEISTYNKTLRTDWVMSDGGVAMEFRVKLGAFTPEQIKAAASIKCTISGE